MPGKNQDRLAYTLLIVYYSMMLALAFIASGTGDDGDSVSHFIYSKYAFESPENFINHWAKPVFVLFSSAFSQFGFTGIKVFNVTVTSLAIFFAYRIGRKLHIANAWVIVIILACAPMYLQLSLSSLTEPLFALAMSIIIFLALRGKIAYATILTSFLPFMRSEGLIILLIYACYLLHKRRWKLIPLLVTGHLVYSIIGWFYYRDFLWVFNEMTYAHLSSAYGSGSPFTFILGMYDLIGIPLSVLLVIGTLSGMYRLFKDILHSSESISPEEWWLVYGGFYSLLVSHTIFWAYGMFNSYGLVRVLIAVIPCAGLICLRGFNVIVESKTLLLKPAVKEWIGLLILFIILLNPFLQLNWKCSFELSANEKATLKAANKYKDELEGYVIYSSSPFSQYIFNRNISDRAEFRFLTDLNGQHEIPAKSAIVWDEYYAQASARIALSNLEIDDRFKLLDTFQARGCNDYVGTTAVFVYRGIPNADWEVKNVLYQNDFETADSLQRDSTFSFSGKYSVVINDQNPFSPGYFSKMDDTAFSNGATVRIRAQFYAKVLPIDPGQQAVFVVAIDHKGKNYFWKGFNIENVLTEGHLWKNVSFKITLPVPEASSDQLGVYIWNPHPFNLYVDDMRVELLEAKEK